MANYLAIPIASLLSNTVLLCLLLNGVFFAGGLWIGQGPERLAGQDSVLILTIMFVFNITTALIALVAIKRGIELTKEAAQ